MFKYKLINYYSNRSISLIKIRLLHSNSVLFAGKSNIGSVREKMDRLDILEFTPVTEEILKSNLQELRLHSQQMTPFEYLNKIQGEFDKGLGGLGRVKYENYLQNNNRNIESIAGEAVNKLSTDGGSVSSAYGILSNMEGINTFDKMHNFMFGDVNKISDEKVINILRDSVNKDYKDLMSPKADVGKLIEVQSDGKILFDPAKIEELINTFGKEFIDKVGVLDSIYASIFVFGVSNLMAYRGILWAYDKDIQSHLSSFKSESARLEAFKHVQLSRQIFSGRGSLCILVGLNCIFYFNRYVMGNNISLGVNVISTPSSNNPQNSLIFLLTAFKKLNKWLKIIIILILIPIIIYSSYPYLSYLRIIYVNFLNSNMFKFKLLVCLIIIFIILYNILELYLINKFSKLSDKPILNKYLPSKVSNKIFSIYKISQSCDNDRSLIISIILKNMISHILLLIFVITTLLIST